jgi:hypothetical protein
MLTAVLTALKAVKDAALTALKAVQDAEKKTTPTKTKYKDSGYDDLCFSGSSIPSLCVCVGLIRSDNVPEKNGRE